METESKEPVKLMVEGMTCNHCALSISRYLEKEGLKEVSVNVGAGEVFFSNPSQTPLEKIKEGIHRLGYKVAEQGSQKKSKWSTLEIQFFFCSIFTVLLVLPMIVNIQALHEPMVQLFLSVPVLLMGMNYFGRSAWHSLRSGMPNMDVLIAIGSLSAFIYSVGGMILYKDHDVQHQHLFFETSATIITLVMLGNIIEHRSVKRTNQSLDELLQLRPEMARQLFIDANGKESIKEIPAKDLIRFDTAIVNSGDQVPADGKIISGQAVIDESAMTGESMPAEKIMGDEVHAGTIVKTGSIRVKVERVGEETLLSSIIKMVKNANLNKPQIQQVGDRVSAIFVPAVLVIAAVTFIVSYFFLHVAFAGSLMRSVAVMVISCPCAMGLATPTAIAVGLGRAAREGILIRGGRTAESFQKINTIVFDKTGTLTTGKFSIADVKYYGMEPAEAKSIIAEMESQSSHPLAKSLHDYFKEGGLEKTKLKSVREEKGIGMHAEDENGNNFSITSHANRLIGEQQQYDIFLLKNGNVIAAVKMMDEIRKDAAETIEQLKQLSYEVILLSGDKEEKCRKVATVLGIEKVFAEQLPDQKAAIIQSLKRKGKVMMVGDGINDAPSLAYADAAISFGNASNIAVNQAGIILLNDRLSDIIKALQMTKHILITVRQNLFWAFFYNVLAIPIAAAGFLSPMIGALSMAFSDVIVIGNSIRLRFKKDTMNVAEKIGALTKDLHRSHVNAYQIFTLSRFAAFAVTGILLAKGGISIHTIGNYETLMFLSGAVSFFWIGGILNSFLASFTPSPGKKDSFLFTVFILLCAISGVIFLFLNTFYASFSNLLSSENRVPFFKLFSFYILISNPAFLMEYIFLAYRNSKALITYSILNFFGSIGVVILPLYFSGSLYYSIAGLICLASVKIIVLVFLLDKHSHFRVDFRMLFRHLVFSLPLILSLLASGAGDYIDGVLVTHFFGTSSFAIFRYGAKEFPISLLMANALSTAMIPVLAAPGEFSAGLKELRKRATRLMHLLFPVTIILLLASKWIYPLVLNEQFSESAGIFNIYLLLIISRMVFPQSIVLAKRKNRVLLFASLIEIGINIATSLWLMQDYGIKGIAFGTLIAFYAEKIILAVYCKVKLKIDLSDYLDLKPFLFYSFFTLLVFVLIL